MNFDSSIYQEPVEKRPRTATDLVDFAKRLQEQTEQWMDEQEREMKRRTEQHGVAASGMREERDENEEERKRIGAAVAARQTLLAERREAARGTIEETRRRLKQLRDVQQMFRERLGLRVVRDAEAGLRVAFCRLDPANPKFEASCAIAVREGAFVVGDCVPERPEGMDDIVQRLNESHDLARAIVEIRAVFRNLYPKE